MLQSGNHIDGKYDSDYLEKMNRYGQNTQVQNRKKTYNENQEELDMDEQSSQLQNPQSSRKQLFSSPRSAEPINSPPLTHLDSAEPITDQMDIGRLEIEQNQQNMNYGQEQEQYLRNFEVNMELYRSRPGH